MYRPKWPPGLGAWPHWPRWASWPRRPGPPAARWKWRWTPTPCSRTDRWERWQLHSLADDLAESRGAALAEALRRSPSLDGQAAGHEWLAERAAALPRAALLAHRVEVGASPSLSLIALAVRAVGDTVEAG